MATEDMNITEDTEMAECDGDKVVTMMDVLQEQQDFEEDANDVLGASDDKNCTYTKGYIKRQAIYACLTCCPDAKTDPTKRAGVCLACSLNCHENHEYVELHTKRNFRCDCGNPKFNSHPCQFTPNKNDLNNDNLYNQNFGGLYCICHRPYPDPESNFEDDMIQCIICEDWLHVSHLDAVVPANDQYSEMICKECMDKNEFLHDYSNLAVNVESVDIVTVNGNHTANICNGDVIKTKDQYLVPNVGDVDIADEKEQASINSDNSKTLEDESKQMEGKIEIESKSDDTDNNATLNADSINDQDAKKDDSVTTIQNTESDMADTTQDVETKKGNDIASNADENKHSTTDDKLTNVEDVTKIDTDACQEQQQDEQSTNDVNARTDKTEVNQTEDQLLDDIRALTSDNSFESTSIEGTSAKDEKTMENVEKGESLITLDESKEKAPLEQTSELQGSPAKSSVEPINHEISDTSQEIPEKGNVEDKTDEVMDAINAFLEASTETKDSEHKESDEKSSKNLNDQEETQKLNEVDMSDSDAKQNDNQSEKNESATTANSEKTDTDVEMGDCKGKNKLSESEKRLDSETTDDTKEKESDNVKVSDDLNETNNQSADQAEDSVTNADKVLNGNIPNKTENTTKGDSEDKTKNESAADGDKANSTKATNENKRKLSVTEESSTKKGKYDNPKCVRPKGVNKVHKGATFWPSNFRQKLCTCGECISMYKDLHVLFLTDLEDTMSFYKSLGKENVDAGVSQYEKGLLALSSLDRIQQINALTEYNKMRDKLVDFLKSFKDRKEIVKEEDIRAFFADMKPKREPDGVYFCR